MSMHACLQPLELIKDPTNIFVQVILRNWYEPGTKNYFTFYEGVSHRREKNLWNVFLL